MIGVIVFDAKNSVIGGAIAGARNIISGNSNNGIEIDNAGNTGTLVQGNFVGLNAAGTARLATEAAASA